jgi:hypothetical protein
MGVIQREVLAILDQADHSIAPVEIHDAIERWLGRLVSYDIVSSSLSVAARDPVSAVVRVGRGLYRA